MKTPGVPQRLQNAIRRHFCMQNEWQDLAARLGIGTKSLQYQLRQELGREVTFHFCGLLAVLLPEDWAAIQVEMVK